MAASCTLPRLCIDEKPLSANIRYWGYDAIQDFQPGSKYWQIDGSHEIVALAVERLFLPDYGDGIELEPKLLRKVDRTARFIAESLSNDPNSFAVFIEPVEDDSAIEPAVVIYQRLPITYAS